MQPTRVTSSVLATVLYSPEEQTLTIEFRSGRVYEYRDVPEATYDALVTAESKARYFNEALRDAFPSREIVPH